MAAVTSMSSIAYAFYTLYEALPRMARRGFKNVEIGSFNSYCFHFNDGSPTASELKTALTEYDLTPVSLNWTSGEGHAYDKESTQAWLDAYKKKIDQVKEVGFPMMTMHFGRYNEGNDIRDQQQAAIKVYRELAEYALTQGMKMLLELPHLQLIHSACEPVYDLLDQLDLPNVGILMDSSHWGVIGYDLDEYLDRVGERLWHIHLRDSIRESTPELTAKFVRKGANRHFNYNLTLTPGLGTVDFRKLGEALDRIGYSRDVSTEFEYFDMTLDEIERQYDAGLKHLQECGWELPETVRTNVSSAGF